MEALNRGIMDFSVLGNPARSWLTSALVALLLFLVLRFLRSRLSRTLRVVADKTENRFDDALVDLVSRTRLFVLIVISIWAGSRTLTLPDGAYFFVKAVLVVSVLLQVAVWGNSIIELVVRTYVRLEEEDDASRAAMATALAFIGKVVLWSVVLLVGLQNLGVEVTALMASLGVGGIAVALASQNLLGDLFASLSIYFDKPFVVGDFIVVSDLAGTVEKIGLKTTRVRSLQGEQLVFSNNDLLGSRIHNYKRMLERRILFRIGIVYGTPYEKLVRVPQIIQKTIEQQDLVRFDRAHFRSYGDSSLDFEIVYWVTVPDYNTYMDIQQRINFEIFRRFQEEGIHFAYPTRTVYMAEGKQSLTSPV